jgi:murein DD-endopeptidase MepM/ murein hydrolase activator NlpD
MRAFVELCRTRPWSHAAAFALIAISAAGCSSEVTRFDENPFASRNAQAQATGSIAPAPAAPSGRIESQPLPPSAAAAPTPPASVASAPMAAPQPAAYQPAPQAAYQPQPYQTPSYQAQPAAQPQPSYQPPYRPAGSAEVTGTVAGRHPSAQAAWHWDGGTPVTVAAGDTVESLGRKHGVPASAILQANGLTNPAILRPGQRLVIPRYSAASVVARAEHGRSPTPPGGAHVVAAGETLNSLSRHYGKSVSQIAAANHISPSSHLKIGERIVIPGAKPTMVAAKTTAPAAPAHPAAPVHQEPAVPHQKVASAEPQPSARVAAPTAEKPSEETVGSAPTSAHAPSFRWPVRGRIITGFGPKTNGQQNDGIDLAVPEGTAVRAAEDGVVAYAGNELKGYGNLILVRHNNGFVTAYAHASELMVKRGDQIRRGQVIARSGQTGNVSSPQLHFEIRKGSAPVDPLQYLPGA